MQDQTVGLVNDQIIRSWKSYRNTGRVIDASTHDIFDEVFVDDAALSRSVTFHPQPTVAQLIVYRENLTALKARGANIL